MKISLQYPNFKEGLMYVISDKHPHLGSDDNKKFAYQIQLANFRMGCDFYELNRAKDGGVYFSLVTMVGMKIICETNSNYRYRDMSIEDWRDEISFITLTHFNKEEYQALKKGYVKKKGNGCLGMLVFIPLLIGVVMFNM